MPPEFNIDEQKERFFKLLEELYGKLDEELRSSKNKENTCGTCRECCTGSGLSQHRVTSLEFEFVESRVGSESIQTFRKFTERDGQVELCPYFDEEIWGCGIYEHRPFSCRVFGHHRSEDTVLPEVCIFRGQESIFRNETYYESVPKASDLRSLVRRYWPYSNAPVSSSYENTELEDSLEFQGDALDRALFLQSQGDLPQALEVLAVSDLEQTPYSLYCLSLILEGLKLHKDACRALEEALLEAPECSTLHFRLACNRFPNNQPELAAESLERVLCLEPDHVQAMALLAGYFLQNGKRTEARVRLEKAKLLDPEDPFVCRLWEAV